MLKVGFAFFIFIIFGLFFSIAVTLVLNSWVPLGLGLIYFLFVIFQMLFPARWVLYYTEAKPVTRTESKEFFDEVSSEALNQNSTPAAVYVYEGVLKRYMVLSSKNQVPLFLVEREYLSFSDDIRKAVIKEMYLRHKSGLPSIWTKAVMLSCLLVAPWYFLKNIGGHFLDQRLRSWVAILSVYALFIFEFVFPFSRSSAYLQKIYRKDMLSEKLNQLKAFHPNRKISKTTQKIQHILLPIQRSVRHTFIVLIELLDCFSESPQERPLYDTQKA
jgi:hypothetical protein